MHEVERKSIKKFFQQTNKRKKISSPNNWSGRRRTKFLLVFMFHVATFSSSLVLDAEERFYFYFHEWRGGGRGVNKWLNDYDYWKKQIIQGG